MHLYDAQFDTFIPQATSGQIADVLRERFTRKLDQNPSDSEVKSWRNSLGAFAEAVDGITPEDAWIILEYQLPLSSARVDCMILGRNSQSQENAILAEFKQWDHCKLPDANNLVLIGNSEELHPSAQVLAYREYLKDAHSAFHNETIALSSLSYLHNIENEAKSNFFESRFSPLLHDSPAFSLESVDGLCRYIGERARVGAPESLVNSILKGAYRPSKKLLDHVAASIDSYEPWHLLDEQQLIFQRIMADVEQARAKQEKSVIIIVGGPGTGKSVIAVQVLGAAARMGYSVAHATGSKAFTTNLRGIVRRDAPFLYTHNFIRAEPNSVDLVICDEAHRLRDKTQFAMRVLSRRPQVEELIEAAKVSVFLLDGQQSVRVGEIGSVENIRNFAAQERIDTKLYDLKTQFRCAGSESYVRWVDAVLGLSNDASLAWQREKEYEVQLYDNPEAMESALRTKIAQGSSARMVAGFDWLWSDPLATGKLVPDVRIGSWARPWNRKPREMWKNKGVTEKPFEHPYTKWATDPDCFNEIGCIYSVQGFEFDYVGVIFGLDLKWDSRSNRWIPDLTENKDPQFKRGLTKDPVLAFEKLQHLYRVLSTRGMKGTYFTFLDQATRRHFERLLKE